MVVVQPQQLIVWGKRYICFGQLFMIT